MSRLGSLIRDVPDFPKKGIVFKDITPLLADPAGFMQAVDLIATRYRDDTIDLVVGVESRGFIFGAAVAARLGAGFIPIRKPGKLPSKTQRIEYELEYGRDALEIHLDAIKPNQRVLMVDDLLATGGTMKACCDLVRQLGGEIVAIAFLIELAFLPGRKKLGKYEVFSVLTYG
ncbi:MAG: adenine phosphoribosyltransferase [Phycisphaerae bacterium]|nr:adenine phosphoribosyltransferase [Phycisphaerae bacterium]